MTKTALRSTIAIAFCSALLIVMAPSLHKSNSAAQHRLTQAYTTDSAGYAGAIKSSVGSLSWLIAVNGINSADQGIGN